MLIIYFNVIPYITLNTTLIQEIWFTGKDTAELLALYSVLQMGMQLCRLLLMSGNKLGNYEQML